MAVFTAIAGFPYIGKPRSDAMTATPTQDRCAHFQLDPTQSAVVRFCGSGPASWNRISGTPFAGCWRPRPHATAVHHFQGSYIKANRLRGDSFYRPGNRRRLCGFSRRCARTPGCLVTTDVHTCRRSSYRRPVVVDLIQIPAFLSRQTTLSLPPQRRAGREYQKGQFPPRRHGHIADKRSQAGNSNVILTERGFHTGYGDLVVDFPLAAIMRSFDFPFATTLRTRYRPPVRGRASGGRRDFLLPLLRAALRVGIDALFCEVHPDPANAKSDRETQWAVWIA